MNFILLQDIRRNPYWLQWPK